MKRGAAAGIVATSDEQTCEARYSLSHDVILWTRRSTSIPPAWRPAIGGESITDEGMATFSSHSTAPKKRGSININFSVF